MSATEGPWVLVHDEPYEMSIEANGEKVPGLDCWLDDACFDLNGERLANARLAATAPVLADAVADLLSVMEMQEKRESGEFHITGRGGVRHLERREGARRCRSPRSRETPMTFDDWRCTPPDDPPCVCGSPECEACDVRQAAEDRYWARVDQQIDEDKEREWDR